MSDLISRQAAIDVLHGYFDGMLETDTWSPCDVYGLIEILPPAEPPYNMDEWCHDCKEYDQERHCCPRFNKMIRRTLEDMKRNSPKLIYCSECVRKCRFYDTQGDGGYCRYGKDKDGNINPQREVKTE